MSQASEHDTPGSFPLLNLQVHEYRGRELGPMPRGSLPQAAAAHRKYTGGGGWAEVEHVTLPACIAHPRARSFYWVSGKLVERYRSWAPGPGEQKFLNVTVA